MPNLFPTENTDPVMELPEAQASQVKFGQSWRFDFDAGEFVTGPTGKIVETLGIDAWVEWCKKALRTARYRYPIYSRNYGAEFEDLIGRGLAKDATESEIKRMATEALMVDQRTNSVGDFTFNWRDDAVYFTCTVTTAQGEQAQVSGQGG